MIRSPLGRCHIFHVLSSLPVTWTNQSQLSLTMESRSKLSSWCMGVICTADPRAGVSSTPDPTLLVTHHAASGKALNAASIKPCQAHDGRGFAGDGEHVVGWMQSSAMCVAISAATWTGWQLVALAGASKGISCISPYKYFLGLLQGSDTRYVNILRSKHDI